MILSWCSSDSSEVELLLTHDKGAGNSGKGRVIEGDMLRGFLSADSSEKVRESRMRKGFYRKRRLEKWASFSNMINSRMADEIRNLSSISAAHKKPSWMHATLSSSNWEKHRKVRRNSSIGSVQVNALVDFLHKEKETRWVGEMVRLETAKDDARGGGELDLTA
nr:hypothetical protein Iba_chr08aCG14200 [Ipomoea batatas]